MRWILLSLILIFTISTIPCINAENVPDWVKNTAGWWANDAISEQEFVNAIEFLINDGIIKIAKSVSSEKSENAPDWVKNTAGWWANDAISEQEFVNAIEFLVDEGIIHVNEKCKFYDNVKLQTADQWFLCNLNYNYLSDWAESKYPQSKIELNSKGFRGPEFTDFKQNNTIRILTVGGSTTIGIGVSDEFTYPSILQKKINALKLEKKIEIINVGQNAAWSKIETDLIKNKLLSYEPDIFIIYDGWNDIQNEVFNKNNNEELWKERWLDICELEKEKNFHTIILLQPTVATISKEKRILTDQEITILNSHTENQKLTHAYEKYPSMLTELDQKCTSAKNFQNIFDEVYESIFYDYGHTNAIGNKIIAENVLNELKPILEDKFSINFPMQMVERNMKMNDKITNEIDFRGKIFENISFSNRNLKDANFQYTLINNVDFSNSNLENADFRFSIITNSIFDSSNLKNSSFAGSEIDSVNFLNSNLENAYIAVSNLNKVIFLNSNLKNSQFMGTTVQESSFKESDIQNSFFYQTMLVDSNIFDGIFSNATLHHVHLINCDGFGKNLSQINIEYKNRFVNCNFDNVILPTELNDLDLTAKVLSPYGTISGSSFSKVNFEKIEINDIVFSTQTIEDNVDKGELENFLEQYGVNLAFSNFSNKDLSNKNLNLVNFSHSELFNTDLSYANLQFSNLEGANLEGANLEGANLEGANLEGANLEGANLVGTNLNCINHEICN